MKSKLKNDNKIEKSPKEIEFEQLSLFFDKNISNNKLITKYASIAGIARIPYIKGKDLKKFFTDNFEEIKKEMLSITKVDIGKESDSNSLQIFYEINQQRGIFHYLKRIQGDKAKIHVCYWNDWKGLVRDTVEIDFEGNRAVLFERVKTEVLIEYNCGICF